MKKQRTTQVKLTFTKQTIAKLNTTEMMLLRGGNDMVVVPSEVIICGTTGQPTCYSNTKPKPAEPEEPAATK